MNLNGGVSSLSARVMQMRYLAKKSIVLRSAICSLQMSYTACALRYRPLIVFFLILFVVLVFLVIVLILFISGYRFTIQKH